MMARKLIGERAMTPAERQRCRRERQRAMMTENGAASASALEATWRAAGADECQEFCDRHELLRRDAVARSDADAKAGKLDSAYACLEATAAYVIVRLEPAQSYHEATGSPASQPPST